MWILTGTYVRHASWDFGKLHIDNVPCIKPEMVCWLRKRRRFLHPVEKLAFMGLAIDKYTAHGITADQLCSFAGNAYSAVAVLPFKIARLVVYGVP